VLSDSATSDGDIRVVARAAHILGLFSREHPTLRIKDVAAALDVGRTTVYRYLSSMVSAGLLQRAGDGYALGPLATQIGALALSGANVVEIADPYLRQLADATSETAVLAVWGGEGPVVVRSAEPTARMLHISVRLGQRLTPDAAQSAVFAAHGGDSGRLRAQMADMDADQMERINTRLQDVDTYGVAVSDTVTLGTRGVAAPVFGLDGQLAATIAILGTVHTLPPEPDSPQARALRDTADALSLAVGQRESPRTSTR
jgi:DNA-binding IclR family transcriptional regulator